MTSPVRARLCACLATGVLAAVLAPVAAPTAVSAAEPSTPLQVTIDSLSPSTVPDRGSITITGQIKNTSDSVWTDLNVYMLTSESPFTSTDEIEEATRTDPTVEVGGRLTGPGLFATVGDLAPGSSTNYLLSVPREDLEITGDDGVYWLGVHVLGADDTGRDNVADGRARSFIPLMRRRVPQTTLSLVVPVKGRVRREVDGSLDNLRSWQELLSREGRLGRLMDLSGTSSDMPVTWVVDPAVVDAAISVAGDNPPMSTGPTVDGAEGEPPSPSPSPGQSSFEQPTGDPDEDDGAEPSAAAQSAADWLELFRRLSGQHSVMTVPYGDIDVASMLRRNLGGLVEQARELSHETMQALQVQATPVVAPSSGFLPNPVLRRLDEDTPVLLSDAAMPNMTGRVVETGTGQQILLADASAGSGGPAPGPRYAALAMRQRILSEAAVHALSGNPGDPLVVSTPQLWDPGADWRIAQFFSGLDVDWLRVLDLTTAATTADAVRPGEEGFRGPVIYPGGVRRAELPLSNLVATQRLADVGDTFAGLLTQNDTVDEFLAKSAMLASSTRVRARPGPPAARAEATARWVRSLMELVQIQGPSFVTMSSEEGTFAVTVINDLEEPVTVGIEASTGSDSLRIRAPEPVSLGPGQRASVRLTATSNEIGVHSVTLLPTTADGKPLGNETQFSIRSSQVGLVIWLIMGVGGAVLFAAVALRIVRRIRERKATHGPLLRSEQG